MKKVYIVTSGYYSDYGISAVYENIEDATEYIFSLNDDEARIETYEIGISKSKSNRSLFSVTMDISGNSIKVDKIKLEDDKELEPWSIHYPFIYIKCFADDETHAVKIANEKRISLKANHIIK